MSLRSFLCILYIVTFAVMPAVSENISASYLPFAKEFETNVNQSGIYVPFNIATF